MSKESHLVSVVVLNWNKPDDTLACIESLQNQTYKKIEIIIVDNGSVDGSKATLSQVRGIIYVDNPINRGFTGGHIDGLKVAQGEFILVLNNDAVLAPDYVEKAVEIAEGGPDIAVVGGRSYVWDAEHPPLNTANPYYAFQNINPYTAEGIFEQSDLGHDHEVSWVSGSSMLIRKSVIDEVGYFYNPFFAYYEESDLFARFQRKGYKIVYSPTLHIWHQLGKSSTSSFQLRQLFKNRFVFAMRNFETRYLLIFLKNYLRLVLGGVIGLVLGRGDKTTNVALAHAGLYNLIRWPRWLVSRYRLNSYLGKSTYCQNLKTEQTGVSVIFSGDIISNLDELVQLANSLALQHHRSEIICVIDKKTHQKVLTKFSKHSIPRQLRLVVNAQLSKANPLNLGWLSATNTAVWFLDKNRVPIVSEIKTYASLNPQDFELYIEKEFKSICVSRRLLSVAGGLHGHSLSESFALLCYFADKLEKTNVRAVPADMPLPKQVYYMLTKAQKETIEQDVSVYKKSIRAGRLTHFLDRHYRSYQTYNLIVWLFIPAVSLRLKAARIRNLALFTIHLDRRQLALELKHMRNEVIIYRQKGFNPVERATQVKELALHTANDNIWQKTPVFIICRDRLSPLKQLIAWLEKAGMQNIILVDNQSIYPPLVEYLAKTDYQVVKTNKNIGHTVVWAEGMAHTLFPGEFYIVTDPDVIPSDECPDDAVKYLYTLHAKYGAYLKIGFGLRIDDLPKHYKLREQVINWESQFWANELEPNVYEASLDTTFALYKPHTNKYLLHPSIRTGEPYTAQHLPWYVDSSKIDEEEAFYRMHASQNITSWNTDEILERYRKEMSE
jgi:GT2 family glycosyltransferase